MDINTQLAITFAITSICLGPPGSLPSSILKMLLQNTLPKFRRRPGRILNGHLEFSKPDGIY
jgi:hypothetical protein